MNNAEIAALLYELSALMDLKGDVYKRNAYRKAAQSIEALDAEVGAYRAQGKLETIPGVGKAIAQKITEMLDTGRLHKLEELRAEFPPGILELTRVPEIGPRTMVTLYRELGVKDLDDLRRAAEQHRIRKVKADIYYFEAFFDPYMPLLCKLLLKTEKIVIGIHDVIPHQKFRSRIARISEEFYFSRFRNYHFFLVAIFEFQNIDSY
jgi:hypothetical protein